MAHWSASWGLAGIWGAGGLGASVIAEANSRVLIQFKPKGEAHHRFRDMITVLAARWANYETVMADIAASLDVATAIGDQLDKIGSIVGLPRQGYSDSRYRTFLEIQIDLLLSARRDEANWTGTGNNLLTIARKFVGPTVDPVILQNLPPYAYQMSVPGVVSGDEAEILARFLCRATYAGVQGYIVFGVAGENSNWGSETAGAPIAGSGPWASESAGAPITSPMHWGFTIAIGGDPEC